MPAVEPGGEVVASMACMTQASKGIENVTEDYKARERVHSEWLEGGRTSGVNLGFITASQEGAEAARGWPRWIP